MLKGNFHAHYIEANVGDPWSTVEYHKKEGYSILALTEHGDQTNLGVELQVQKKVGRVFGNDFFLLPGKECTAAGDPKGRFPSNDVNAIDLKGNVCSYDYNGALVGYQEHIDEIHRQGGLAIFNHECVRQRDRNPKKRFRHHRNLHRFDAWELGHGLGICVNEGSNVVIPDPQEIIDEGYLVTADADSHRDFQALSIGIYCHTWVFAEERTHEGVRRALDNSQTICYVCGFCYGKKKWIDIFRAAKLKQHASALRRWQRKPPQPNERPSASALFALRKEGERLEYIAFLMRYYSSFTPLGREYALAEHEKVCLFLLTEKISRRLRNAIRDMMYALSNAFLWEIEDAFMAGARQRLADAEVRTGHKKRMTADDMAKLGLLAYNIDNTVKPKALDYFARALRIGCVRKDFLRAYALCAAKYDSAIKGLAICKKALEVHPNDLVVIGLAHNQERRARYKSTK